MDCTAVKLLCLAPMCKVSITHQYDVRRAAAPRNPLVEVRVRQIGVLQVVPQHAVACNTHAGRLATMLCTKSHIDMMLVPQLAMF